MPRTLPSDRTTRLLGLAQRTKLLEGLEPLDQMAIVNALTRDDVTRLVQRDPLWGPMKPEEQNEAAERFWSGDAQPINRGLGRKLLDIGADIAPVAAATWMGARRGAEAGAGLPPIGIPPFVLPGKAFGAAAGAVLGGATSQAMLDLLKHGAGLLGIESAGEPAPQTSMEAAQRIGMAGAMGPLQEASAIRGAAGAVPVVGPAVRKWLGSGASKTGIPELAAEFKVPVTAAQQKQGIAASGFESLVRRSIGGLGVFREFDTRANEALIKAGRQIADDISGVKMSPREAGVYVQEAMSQARKSAGEAYAKVIEDVSQKAGTVRLDVSGTLQKDAQKLLSEWKDPTEFATKVREIEGVSKAMGILEQFADPTITRNIPASKVLAAGGEPAIAARTIKEPKALPFDEARKLRTLLFKISESGEMTIGKGSLSQLNHSLNDAMGAALEKAGKADLATQFRRASARFRHSRELLEQSTMEAIAKTDKPETILGILTHEKGAESSMRALRKIVKSPDQRRAIARGVWEQILEVEPRGAMREGVLVGNRLEKIVGEIGNPAMRTIFGGEHLGTIERFAKLADTVSLRSSLTRPLSAQGPTLMMMGQTGAVVGGVLQQGPEGWLLAGVGLLSPYVMARILIRPGATQVMTKALTTSTQVPSGRAIAARLAAWAVEAQQESDRDRTPQLP